MRNYTAAKILSEAWQRVRIKRAVEDPYEVVQRRLKRAAECLSENKLNPVNHL